MRLDSSVQTNVRIVSTSFKVGAPKLLQWISLSLIGVDLTNVNGHDDSVWSTQV